MNIGQRTGKPPLYKVATLLVIGHLQGPGISQKYSVISPYVNFIKLLGLNLIWAIIRVAQTATS